MKSNLNNTHTKFELKTMSSEDLNYTMDWVEEEGWNPGIYDHLTFHQADPNGFFIGELLGRPIGCISAVRYNEKFGFIGMFFIEEEFRKQWFGTYMARTALSYLGKRTIGLNGVPDKMSLYEKIGFKFAYNCLRFQGIGHGCVTKDVTDINEIELKELIKYDSKIFFAERVEFLKSWINQSESSTFCVLENKKIAGYGTIRRCREGYKIGPLFANTPALAEKLFITLSSCAPNENIYIDVPDKNFYAISMMNKFKMNECFSTIRMYSAKQPVYPVDKVFGITSVELG